MAASREEIDLIVNAVSKGFDKLEGDIKGIEKATDNAGDAAKGGGLRFTELSSALNLAQQGFQVVAQAAEFAYTNIKEGAQLELAAQKFDNLSQSIGTTADSLLTNLKQATNGMVSDAELIAGATDIINLGLGKTEEETVRLATAVSTLGLDMQQVILTFANNSTMRLDALGLSVEGVTQKAAELEAQGFKGDAFDEAVLISLEEKMTLLGDASQTTAGQLQILESDWKNLTDELKQGAAEIAGPVVSAIVANRKEASLLKQAYEDGLITYMEYQRGVSATSEGTKTAAEVLTEYNFVLDENGQIIGSVVDGHVKLNAQMEKGADDAAANTEAITAYHQAAAAAAGPNEELADKVQQTNNRLSEQEAFAAAANASMHMMAGAADTAAAAFSNESQEVSQLQQLLATLPSEVSTSVDLQVYGINTLERAQALLNSLQNPMGAGADPYGGFTPGQTVSSQTPAAADPYANLGNTVDQGIVPTGPGGQTNTSANSIVQVNNFNNPTNPNAIANATAEKLGSLK